MKYIRVEMPDLSKWDIPAELIANIRAKYYADREGKESKEKYNKVFKEEYKIAMKDDYELIDWLSNNTNWDEVKDVAKKVSEIKLANEDLQEGIINGEKEIIEK